MPPSELSIVSGRWTVSQVHRHSRANPRSIWPRSFRIRALTPAAEAIRGELQRRFQYALAQLDSDDREIILLRHFEQSSNSEAARILGLSEAAAGMRHLRALRRLRAVLGESPSLC